MVSLFTLISLAVAQSPKLLNEIANLSNATESEQPQNASSIPSTTDSFTSKLPLPLPAIIAIAATTVVLVIVIFVLRYRKRKQQERKLRSLAKKGKLKSQNDWKKAIGANIEEYDALSEYEKRMIINTNGIESKTKFAKSIDGSMVPVAAGYDGGSVEVNVQPKVNKSRVKTKSPPLTILPQVKEEP